MKAAALAFNISESPIPLQPSKRLNRVQGVWVKGLGFLGLGLKLGPQYLHWKLGLDVILQRSSNL